MTRRVADAEEDGPVQLARFCQCLFAPGEPIDGVVGVLLEVRTRLIDEAIGHGMLRLDELALRILVGRAFQPDVFRQNQSRRAKHVGLESPTYCATLPWITTLTDSL